MGIHRVVIHPRALRIGQPRQVELAHGNHRVAIGIFDVVAINGELIGKLVVLAVLLELIKRGRNDRRIEQADLCSSLSVLLKLARLSIGPRRIGSGLNIIQIIGRQRGINVALDVRRFLLHSVWSHLEVLNQSRVGPRDNQHGHEPNGNSGPSELPQSLDRRQNKEHTDE